MTDLPAFLDSTRPDVPDLAVPRGVTPFYLPGQPVRGRLVWKCNAHNAASVSAAQRLGFTPEGLLRAHKVVKGHLRDTAMFSITAPEWPSRRDALTAWLAAENFAPDGTAKQGLAALRG